MAKLKNRVKRNIPAGVVMLKESDTSQVSQQVASLNVPCAWTYGHIYEGHKLIKNFDYIDALSETTSLYEGLEPKQARHMRVERKLNILLTF